MRSEWVVIATVSTVFATVVAAVVAATIVVAAVIAAAVGAFGSLLLGHLIPNVKVIIISSGGHPRTWATIVGVVATPIVLRLGRHLLVVFPLHALDARRPLNGSRDLLSFDGGARCDSSGPLDLDGFLELASLRLLHRWLFGFLLNSKLLGDTMVVAWVQNIA
jgi:hypothetical protein